jgi:hypothetical protein
MNNPDDVEMNHIPTVFRRGTSNAGGNRNAA